MRIRGLPETMDPYCLREGEAATLLAGHPWRRFAVLGDSIAEGVGDPLDGYCDLGWADRVAEALRAQRPALADYVPRLGSAALDFQPDLALVACGGNDAMRPGYDPDAVDRDLTAIVTALRDGGAAVVTISLLVMADYPAFPEWFRPAAVANMHVLARHTSALATALGTIHIDMADHPAGRLPDLLLSRDGLHANARSHAICAAEAIRRLGAHLR